METHTVIRALGEAELELLRVQGHLQIHSEFKGNMNYRVRPYLKKVKSPPQYQETILKCFHSPESYLQAKRSGNVLNSCNQWDQVQRPNPRLV